MHNFSQDLRLISVISQIGLVYHVVIVVGMHKLRPEYDFRSRYISEYAIGEYGKLAASSFIVFGLSILGIDFDLTNVLPLSNRSNFSFGLALLLVWGVSKIVIGFFKVDLKNERFSPHGAIHTITSCIGVGASAIGLIFLSFNFTNDKFTRPVLLLTQMLAILGSALVIILFIGLLGDLIWKYHKKLPGRLLIIRNLTGIIERLLLGISVAWLLIIANRII